MKRLFPLLTVLLLLAMVPETFAQGRITRYRVVKNIPVAGDGGWGDAVPDNTGLRLFTSHGDAVEVIDLMSDSVSDRITGIPGAKGILLVPGSGKGFVTAATGGEVVEFDLYTLSVTGKIMTPPDPSLIVYDPVTGKIFIFCDNANEVRVADAGSGTPAGTILLPGIAAGAVSGENGKVYCTLSGRSSVVRIDARTLKTDAEWKLTEKCNPAGIAWDERNRLLFAVCGATNEVTVMDGRTGKIFTVLPAGSGAGEIIFIPDDRNLLVANRLEGTVTVYHQKSPQEYALVQTIRTRRNAGRIRYDKVIRRFYLPVADTYPVSGQQKIRDGTFGIIVIGRKLTGAAGGE